MDKKEYDHYLKKIFDKTERPPHVIVRWKGVYYWLGDEVLQKETLKNLWVKKKRKEAK